jgi:hypothetical protein
MLWISYPPVNYQILEFNPAIHRGGLEDEFQRGAWPQEQLFLSEERAKERALDFGQSMLWGFKDKRQVFQHQKTGVNQSKQIN